MFWIVLGKNCFSEGKSTSESKRYCIWDAIAFIDK